MSTRNVLYLMAWVNILLWAELATAQTGYIHLRGDQFVDEFGNDFFPMVMSYYVDCAFPGGLVFDTPPTTAQLANCHIQRSSLYGDDGGFDWEFEHGSILDGEAAILRDFHEMDNLGFNTVRLVMTPYKKAGTGFTIDFLKDFGDATVYHFMDLDPPYDPSVNVVAAWHFDNVLKVCSLANVVGLKVILICADKGELLQTWAQAADYANYLAELAKVIVDHNVTNLLAYEFIGEPTYAYVMHSRTTICSMADLWVSAIHQHDLDHLTTIGGVDIVWDTFHGGWDPLLLPVDFANMHFYLDPRPYQLDEGMSRADIIAQAIKRYTDKAYVYSKKIRKPYIISETSFPAHDHLPGDNYVFPISVLGDEADMAAFIEATYPLIRDSRAAGYGWWDFQQKHWFADPPDDPNTPLGKYLENHMGILRRGDPDHTDLLNGYHNVNVDLRKEGAQTFADWKTSPPPPSVPYVVPSTVDMNDLFYNPNNHPVNTVVSAGRYGTVTGHVVDQFGEPIENAIVSASTYIGPGDALNGYHTFTDHNGDFEIRAYDPDPLHTGNQNIGHALWDRCVGVLKVSTYGGGWRHFGMWSPDTEGPIVNNATIVVRTLESRFDLTVDGVVVPIGSADEFNALASVNASNVTVEGDGTTSGGYVNMWARYEVHLQPGFDAEKGAYLHVWTEPGTPDCFDDIDAADLRSAGAPFPSAVESKAVQAFVELEFHRSEPSLRSSVYPNPAEGSFHVQLTSDEQEMRGSYRVTDGAGRDFTMGEFHGTLFTVDLSSGAPGVYHLNIEVGCQQIDHSLVLLTK